MGKRIKSQSGNPGNSDKIFKYWFYAFAHNLVDYGMVNDLLIFSNESKSFVES